MFATVQNKGYAYLDVFVSVYLSQLWTYVSNKSVRNIRTEMQNHVG